MGINRVDKVHKRRDQTLVMLPKIKHNTSMYPIRKSVQHSLALLLKVKSPDVV